MEILNGGYSRDAVAMHLLQCLFFSAVYDFQLYARHLPDSHNEMADTLSRNRLSVFQGLHPVAEQQPTIIPEALVEILMGQQPNWLSPNWRRLFKSICTHQ